MAAGTSSFCTNVYRVVKQVPRGRVVTYGWVAGQLGTSARAVGNALSRLPYPLTKGVPWHRVVNVRGGLNQRDGEMSTEKQRALLEKEGVAFNRNGEINLRKYGM